MSNIREIFGAYFLDSLFCWWKIDLESFPLWEVDGWIWVEALNLLSLREKLPKFGVRRSLSSKRRFFDINGVQACSYRCGYLWRNWMHILVRNRAHHGRRIRSIYFSRVILESLGIHSLESAIIAALKQIVCRLSHLELLLVLGRASLLCHSSPLCNSS